MHVASLTLRNFRSYERAEIDLPPGITVVQGPVGAGKTNLLEALYLGCLGRSFRTSREADLIRRGESVARVTLTTAPEPHVLEVGHRARPAQGLPRRRRPGRACARQRDPPAGLCVCARPARAGEGTGGRAAGPPGRGHRRALARCPGGAAVLPARPRAAQRASRACEGWRPSQDSLAGWNREVARHGFELMERREEAIEQLAPRFQAQATALGLPEPGSWPTAALSGRERRAARAGARGAPLLRPRSRLHDSRTPSRRAAAVGRRGRAAPVRIAGPAAPRPAVSAPGGVASCCATSAARPRSYCSTTS